MRRRIAPPRRHIQETAPSGCYSRPGSGGLLTGPLNAQPAGMGAPLNALTPGRGKRKRAGGPGPAQHAIPASPRIGGGTP